MRSLVTAVLLLLAAAAGGRASELPVTVLSQNNAAWARDRMGTGGTIGQQGCMMTSVAMALQASPKVFNNWLNTHGGYAAGGVLIPTTAAAVDGSGGLQYVGPGQLPANAASVDRGIARGGVYVTRSFRFREHWVLVYKSNGQQSYYVDPWDGTVRRAGDGWVNYGNEARIYAFAR